MPGIGGKAPAGSPGGTALPARACPTGTSMPPAPRRPAAAPCDCPLGTRFAARPLRRHCRGQIRDMTVMDRLDQFFGVHGEALQLRSERLGLLASNIANAATPNYKARDLDFSAALAGERTFGLWRTHGGHLVPSGSGPADGPSVRYRRPLQPSLDGNTVELATEQLQFAETALRYRSTIGILNSRIQGLTSALKGE
jgi:flagellar basal-body rod protein FlgB